jgi:tRNA(Ile)-lysidine synthase
MTISESKKTEGSLPDDFKNFWESNKCWKKGDSFFLACSGGLDSVVLANLLLHTGVPFTILHCNFQLRGIESDRDEAFVRGLAEALDVSCLVKHFDTRQEMNVRKKGLQETARILRYNWFEEILKGVGEKQQKAWLITAHHADDQLETIVMNFFRGTGIAGLQGMSFKREYILRPLLFAAREAIYDFATQNGIAWVEDSSNTDVHYTRNRFRQIILPEIEKAFPNAANNVLQTAKHLNAVAGIYSREVDKQIAKLLENKGDHFAIPINKLKLSPYYEAVIFEICKRFGFGSAQVDAVKYLLEAPTGKFINSETHRILKNRDWLLINPISSAASQIIIVENPNSKFELNGRSFMVSVQENLHPPDSSQNQAWLDFETVSFPLVIRPVKTGDYFYPLGMKKKKKISRFLTDLKLSRYEKEKQWVVESERKIIWVLGHRIDDRFKINAKTKSVLLLNWT